MLVNVVTSFSAQGWLSFYNLMSQSPALSSFVSKAKEVYYEPFTASRLFIWDGVVDTSNEFAIYLTSTSTQLNVTDHFTFAHYDDDTMYNQGGFIDPFGVRIPPRKITYDIANTIQEQALSLVPHSVNVTTPPTVPSVIFNSVGSYPIYSAAPTNNIKPSTTVLNNYTCKLCKNHRCNTSEKSCWKCGTEIEHKEFDTNIRGDFFGL
jgi:hypothetical protein